MHVFGHSFSQKRKCQKRPRDLHIRKVSFSGSSVSGSSLDSSSTASACTAIPPSQYRDSTASPHHPPPRLYERPFIAIPDRRHTVQPTTFYDSDVIDDVDDDMDDEILGDVTEIDEDQFHLEMPPHSGSIDLADDDEDDYFYMAVTKRPQINRSRWSESTIQTIATDMSRRSSMASVASSIHSMIDESEVPPVLIELPSSFTNLQQPRAHSVPGATKRPGMVHMDGVESFIKRGGWKRRGIVFHGEEIYSDCDGFSLI
ncbi:unnamed protein product [Clonostachys solani]|uniref:Uncharacterized protein n=1 Tax=Clonostachys solani TaxID=160281 RepID=A0A9N9YQT5_9HYPO|nr:unnamed protein product [Clonostachys solani]